MYSLNNCNTHIYTIYPNEKKRNVLLLIIYIEYHSFLQFMHRKWKKQDCPVLGIKLLWFLKIEKVKVLIYFTLLLIENLTHIRVNIAERLTNIFFEYVILIKIILSHEVQNICLSNCCFFFFLFVCSWSLNLFLFKIVCKHMILF